jgi:hypothetical protein
VLDFEVFYNATKLIYKKKRKEKIVQEKLIINKHCSLFTNPQNYYRTHCSPSWAVVVTLLMTLTQRLNCTIKLHDFINWI